MCSPKIPCVTPTTEWYSYSVAVIFTISRGMLLIKHRKLYDVDSSTWCTPIHIHTYLDLTRQQ
jgi:hypothetical protein